MKCINILECSLDMLTLCRSDLDNLGRRRSSHLHYGEWEKFKYLCRRGSRQPTLARTHKYF